MIAGTFNEWFTLAHKTRTGDGQGGWTYTWAQYATERGRLSRMGRGDAKSEERTIGAQLQEWASHLFFCRPAVPVERGDQITDSSGVNYLVLAVRSPSAIPRRHLECECREVQAGQ
jgi:hypothetical protein